MTVTTIKDQAIKIGYADDHIMVRKGISEFINTFDGCQVILEADNGRSLLDKLTQAKTLPDICILDIFMPEMNGLETLITLRSKWPQINVLILTGHNTDYYLIQMLRAGANGYLQKNCSPKELELAIKMIYEYGVYNSEILSMRLYRDFKNKQINIPEFTDNEIAVLKYCCSDLSYAEIAGKMEVSTRSVDWYRNSLFKKLNVSSRSSLVMYAIQFGLVALDIDNTGRSLSAPLGK